MKHNVKTGLLIIALVLVVSIPTFALSGTVVSVSGKVELQSASGWVPLKTGDTIESGLIISTGFRSQATLQVAGSNIVVNQLTRLTLEQLTETNDAHNSEVFLDLGSISADVQRAQNKRVGFVVNTPVATASVRGTKFDVSLSTLNVSSGVIEYAGKKGGSVNVAAGNGSKVSSNGAAIRPFINKVNTALGITEEESEFLPSVSDTSYNAVISERNSEVTTANVVVVVGF